MIFRTVLAILSNYEGVVISAPGNSLIAENGTTFLVAEDGATNLVQET